MAQTESILINIIWKICKWLVGLKINKDIADVERDKRKKIENCYDNPSIYLFQDFKRTFNLKSPSKYLFRFIRVSSVTLLS